MDSMYFIFDGIKSEDMGIYLVSMDSGFNKDSIYGGQNIIEENIARKDISYFYKVKRQPLEFSITICPLEELWTPSKRQEVFNWLIKDTYKPFQTCDDLGKVYYCICTNPLELETNGLGQGYITLQFRCDAPWVWSTKSVQTFDLRNNTTTQIIELENRSNVLKFYYPKIEFKLHDTSTSLILKNLTDKGRIFEFTGLELNETISVDNDNKIIETSLENIYRLDNFNKKWFRLLKGRNRIEVTGKAIIQVEMEFPLIR